MVDVPITELPELYTYIKVPVALGKPEILENITVDVPSVELASCTRLFSVYKTVVDEAIIATTRTVDVVNVIPYSSPFLELREFIRDFCIYDST